MLTPCSDEYLYLIALFLLYPGRGTSLKMAGLASPKAIK